MPVPIFNVPTLFDLTPFPYVKRKDRWFLPHAQRIELEFHLYGKPSCFMQLRDDEDRRKPLYQIIAEIEAELEAWDVADHWMGSDV